MMKRKKNRYYRNPTVPRDGAAEGARAAGCRTARSRRTYRSRCAAIHRCNCHSHSILNYSGFVLGELCDRLLLCRAISCVSSDLATHVFEVLLYLIIEEVELDGPQIRSSRGLFRSSPAHDLHHALIHGIRVQIICEHHRNQ